MQKNVFFNLSELLTSEGLVYVKRLGEELVFFVI